MQTSIISLLMPADTIWDNIDLRDCATTHGTHAEMIAVSM